MSLAKSRFQNGQFFSQLASTRLGFSMGDYWLPVDYEHPLVAPHVSHFSHVPLRTIVKFWHSEHMLPV